MLDPIPVGPITDAVYSIFAILIFIYFQICHDFVCDATNCYGEGTTCDSGNNPCQVSDDTKGCNVHVLFFSFFVCFVFF